MPNSISFVGRKDRSNQVEQMPNTFASTYSNPYANDAPSGYGQMYDQLFANNPYRKQTYQSSFWDRVKGALGFKTGYDKWLQDTSTQIAEYDAGVYSQMQQNQYNSPANQAQMMSDAGLNPDLLGVGDVASAAQPAEDPNGMSPAEGDEVGKVAGLVGGFATSMINAFGTAMQIYKNMAEVKQIQNAITGIVADNADKILNVVDKVIVGSVPLSVLESGKGVDSYVNNVDMSQYGFTGQALETANQAFKDRFDSIKNNAELRKEIYARYNAMSETYKVGAAGFLPSSEQPVSPDELFNLQTDSMARAARRILELAQTNEQFKEQVLTPQTQANEFMAGEITQDELSVLRDSDYGAASASNKVTGIESDTFMKQAQRIINEERANMYSILKVKADAGDSLSTSLLHAMALQDMMQFEFSSELDLSLLKGLGSLAGSLFSFGKNGSTSTQTAADSFRKSFGSGLSLRLSAKTK